MFKITVNTDSGQICKEFSKKILLSEALAKMNISVSKPCGGCGVCKKCTAYIDGKAVLSCQTYIDNDTYVYCNTNLKNVQGITAGLMPEFDKDPLVEEGFGAAIDIGTTTVAGYIYKFPQCECVKQLALPNTQAKYGLDVISRIMHSNEGGLLDLQNEIISQIKKLTEGFAIQKYVITGNTTMLHLLTGKNPQSIAVAPYTPQSLFGKWYENAYLPGCISAYVGADITTAILASNMTKNKTSLIVDIGTNGEMALWHNGALTCCSTAAGPAFEGAGIECGTYASKGAINKVYIQNDDIKYTTIENAVSTGICGTGLIDIIACMLQKGIIDETGCLEENYKIADSNVYITPQDIRAVQLAKSAIRSGIDTLLHNSGIDYNDIEVFYIAGGFGSYIDVSNAAKIGLIPPDLTSKAISIGNSAGIGAAMILLSKDNLKKTQSIADNAAATDLASDSYFMDKYIENMVF